MGNSEMLEAHQRIQRTRSFSLGIQKINKINKNLTRHHVLLSRLHSGVLRLRQTDQLSIPAEVQATDAVWTLLYILRVLNGSISLYSAASKQLI